MSQRAEQRAIGSLIIFFGIVMCAGVVFVAAIPLWVLVAALLLLGAIGAGGVARVARRPPGAALLRGQPAPGAAPRTPPLPEAEPPLPQSGRGYQATLLEAEDILGGLLPAGGLDPTFLRMVSWYRELSDELGCRDAFEQVLMTVLVRAAQTAPGSETGSTAASRRRNAV